MSGSWWALLLIVHCYSVGLQFQMAHYGLAALGALAAVPMAFAIWRRSVR